MSRVNSILQRVIRQSQDTPAFAKIADDLRERGDLAEATWVCSRGLMTNPAYSTGHVILAEILKEEGLSRRARDEFGVALELDASNARARIGLAHLLMADGAIQEALTHLDYLLFWQPFHERAQRLYKEATAQLHTQQVNGLLGPEAQEEARSVQVSASPASSDAPDDPPGLVAGREGELAALLGTCPSASGTLIIDKEGLTVASQGALKDTADEVAAGLAGMGKLLNRYLGLMGFGYFEGCLVEGERHAMRVLRYKNHMVVVALKTEAMLGAAEVEIAKNIERLDRRRKVRATDGSLMADLLPGKADA